MTFLKVISFVVLIVIALGAALILGVGIHGWWLVRKLTPEAIIRIEVERQQLAASLGSPQKSAKCEDRQNPS